MRKVLLVLIVLACVAPKVLAQAKTEFSGRPVIKISEGGSERKPEDLTRDKAVNLECVVSKIREKYYWASRENTELLKVESGGFITYLATNGSGYVRVVRAEMKEASVLLGETEKRFDYVEHLLIGLKSVTYYGARK